MACAAPQVVAHCQVPCGIYDDYARVHAMLEDAETSKKAILQMKDLAGKKDIQSQNQIVRWVVNKEIHAQKIIATISDYFLTQRVKADQKGYVQRLKDHHTVITLAMKVKQRADAKIVDQLSKSIEKLKQYYPEHKH